MVPRSQLYSNTLKGGHHGYDPSHREMYTGFIAAGAGVNRGLVSPELSVVAVSAYELESLPLPSPGQLLKLGKLVGERGASRPLRRYAINYLALHLERFQHQSNLVNIQLISILQCKMTGTWKIILIY